MATLLTGGQALDLERRLRHANPLPEHRLRSAQGTVMIGAIDRNQVGPGHMFAGVGPGNKNNPSRPYLGHPCDTSIALVPYGRQNSIRALARDNIGLLVLGHASPSLQSVGDVQRSALLELVNMRLLRRP